MDQAKIGIDAGGTLIKIAYYQDRIVNYHSFPSTALEEAASWVARQFENPAVCVTGGKSHALAERLYAEPKTVLEFDATAQGITYLANQQEQSIGDNFLFVNVGTGTSLHRVNNGKQKRVGGSGVGGGTLMGLAFLMTGMHHYEQIVRNAAEGNRENVDLKVKDIFEGTVPPISGDLTASNFGKTEEIVNERPADEDILAGMIGLVGEVLVTISSQMAGQYDAESIVYVGSSFKSNPLLQEIIKKYAGMIGKKPVFLKQGEYSGALGALLSL
ncbi:pantothenate kinase [Lentibacillus persicus]|uniref:Pantothenate kinase n=1 Tax=Lentibacillus persicus TaxID=640948 RepID=A0A1I1UDK9_9BACI|nr:type II pantothenate kinase [Lentibacillus persicus]SFD68774.1 pantothenate kinase [Lentibacillus persicus]